MSILALDTASDRLSVAVRRPDGRTAARTLTGARQHARQLAALAVELAAEVEVSPGDVRAIALSDGPGSFTGLRVGAAFAKRLARPRSLPIFAASTLLVRAWGAAPEGVAVTVAGVGSALRGELYLAVYRIARGGPGNGGSVQTLVAPAVLAAGADLPRAVPLDLVAGDVSADLLARWSWTRNVRVIGPPEGLPRAAALFDLVSAGIAGQLSDVDSWEPSYGRPAEAQARWEQTHGRPLVDTTRGS